MSHLKIEPASGPPRAHPLLLQFLAENDTPCPGCGYNLRGIATSQCPECAKVLVLECRLRTERSWSWRVGQVALLVGFGFPAMWAVQTIILLGPLMPLMFEAVVAASLAAIALGACSGVWYASKRRIERAPVIVRRAAAGAAVLLAIAISFAARHAIESFPGEGI